MVSWAQSNPILRQNLLDGSSKVNYVKGNHFKQEQSSETPSIPERVMFFSVEKKSLRKEVLLILVLGKQEGKMSIFLKG
jgi:hypothetical protein